MRSNNHQAPWGLVTNPLLYADEVKVARGESIAQMSRNLQQI